MGVREIEAFLTYLASERKVSPATHRHALSALLFLYRQVLDVQLPWMQEIGRPQARQRLPVVLSREEVARLLPQVESSQQLIARLLYGSGLRLMECLRLRIKDLDFDRRVIVVRDGKGSKGASISGACRSCLVTPASCGAGSGSVVRRVAAPPATSLTK